VARTIKRKASRTEQPEVTGGRTLSRRPDSDVGFRRVQVARGFEDIAGQIRSELSQGRLRAGDRLPAEHELAVQFGVSRNTLREALRSLEISGLITLRKGAFGGAFVNDTNGETVVTSIQDMFSLGAVTTEEITQARISIESAIIRTASEVYTAADLNRLRENIELAAEATQRNDFFARADAHLEFHMILARATRNPILIVVMEALIGIMRQFVHSIGSQQIADYVLPSRRRFMQHFEARDAEAAVKEMERHLKRVNRNYLVLLRERSKSNQILPTKGTLDLLGNDG
jgi:GntR family transcriptional regulator, transcriptional repressor for pyruvate dehydrogenase complex